MQSYFTYDDPEDESPFTLEELELAIATYSEALYSGRTDARTRAILREDIEYLTELRQRMEWKKCLW